jgi:hypothetical protein
MHDAALLRAGAFVFEDQSLRLSFAGHEVRVPGFRVIVQPHFHQRHVTEDIFGVLRDGPPLDSSVPDIAPL